MSTPMLEKHRCTQDAEVRQTRRNSQDVSMTSLSAEVDAENMCIMERLRACALVCLVAQVTGKGINVEKKGIRKKRDWDVDVRQGSVLAATVSSCRKVAKENGGESNDKKQGKSS